MSLAEQVAPHLPYLRRLARAVTGNQVIGDAYVADLLQSLIVEPEKFHSDRPARIEAFRLLSKALGQEGVACHPKADADRWERQAAKRMDVIPIVPRLAFLLKSVEGFSIPDIAQILEQTPAEAAKNVEDFANSLVGELATDVLIIEDEPLIALDIEDLVQSLGHRVTSVARTHRQAVAAVAKQKPGLVLADIQLADGSSGIDAVNEILGEFDLPVIFITAYPERLLTGARPEPTFLIAKPFQPEMVKAVISQALFFNEKARAPKPPAPADAARPTPP